MNEFFAMGGYAFYVWSAYGIAAVVVVVEIIAVRARRKVAVLQARIVASEPARPATPSGSVR